VTYLEENRELFSMKDVEKITGLSEHTIRNWCKDFNIQLAKTSGGHRRFTEENIKLIKAIQEKKDGSGWSMKQIGSWLNGELTPEVLANAEVQTNLEKKFESLEEVVSGELGDLKQAVLLLAKKLDEQEKRHQQALLENQATIIDAVEKRLADPVERRTLELSNLMRESIEQKQLEIAAAKEKEEAEVELHKQKEKLGPISRFFSKIGL
jgi:DNA-binding transcriptional MerR regulator